MATLNAREKARHRAGSGGRGWAASPLRKAPLRRVVETVPGDGHLPRELLECGHQLPVRRDMIGETAAERRRCGECLALAEAGKPVPEVRPETAAEREQRLVRKAAVRVQHPLRVVERCADTPAVVRRAVVRLRADLFPDSSDVDRRYGQLTRPQLVDLDLALSDLYRRKGLAAETRALVVDLRDEMLAVFATTPGPVR